MVVVGVANVVVVAVVVVVVSTYASSECSLPGTILKSQRPFLRHALLFS